MATVVRDKIDLQDWTSLEDLMKFLADLVQYKGFDPERAQCKIGKTTGPRKILLVQEER